MQTPWYRQLFHLNFTLHEETFEEHHPQSQFHYLHENFPGHRFETQIHIQTHSNKHDFHLINQTLNDY